MANKTEKAAAIQRIAELSQEIREHDHNYYVLAAPSITDLDYDRKLRALTDLEREFPELAAIDSPTKRLGDKPLDGLVQVAHRVPMLSIESTYSEQELRDFFARTEKLLPGESIEWVVELKVDGVAASIL